ncbi:MAG TPA: type II and III secretion system protein, partial [Thermoguttaceae bacterium]|nr:type II and III secretion system protein [Thermoguttaceae bacterium]
NIQVDDVDVGLILGVVPRITPDGLVVMELRATNSELGDEADGTPISVTETGETLRSPPINITMAETTVATPDGQTVILGGLITKTKASVRRRIPFLSDIPIVRQLFRYDSDSVDRSELLIIMTPHVVRSREDAEEIKQIEAARMHWCLGDVIELHGEIGMRGQGDLWADSETAVIYPDLDPDATAIPMEINESGGNPFRSEMVPMPDAEIDDEQWAEPPMLEPSSGARQTVPRAMPAGSELQMHQVEQARYSGPPAWGDVETAVYRNRDSRASQSTSRYGEAGSVVPSAYQSPVVRRLPPVVPTASDSASQQSVPRNPVRQYVPSAPLR